MNTKTIDVFTFCLGKDRDTLEKIVGENGCVVSGFREEITSSEAIYRTHCIYGALKLMGLSFAIFLGNWNGLHGLMEMILFVIPFNEELAEEEMKDLIETIERIKKINPPYFYLTKENREDYEKLQISGHRIAANQAHKKKLQRLGEILA